MRVHTNTHTQKNGAIVDMMVVSSSTRVQDIVAGLSLEVGYGMGNYGIRNKSFLNDCQNQNFSLDTIDEMIRHTI